MSAVACASHLHTHTAADPTAPLPQTTQWSIFKVAALVIFAEGSAKHLRAMAYHATATSSASVLAQAVEPSPPAAALLDATGRGTLADALPTLLHYGHLVAGSDFSLLFSLTAAAAE